VPLKPPARKDLAPGDTAGLLQVTQVPPEDLHPAPYNPRVELQPGDKDYEALKASLEQWGLVEPLVRNTTTGNVVGGHQRLRVLTDLGYTTVPVVDVALDDEQERLLNVALNKVQGDWDYPRLADVLQGLDTGAVDLGLSGFSTSELEDLFTLHGDEYQRPSASQALVDQFKPTKTTDKNENWLYLEWYADDALFAAVRTALAPWRRGDHELDPEWFVELLAAAGISVEVPGGDGQ
jgi:hypothetical protein